MIRFGVIGAGRITRTFADAIKTTDAELYAIASRSQKKADTYKKDLGFTVAYGSYEAMLNDPKVDVVYVATPHGLHYEQMMMILDYNKAILCEKAFTLNEKEAKAVFSKAKAKNVFVMEAMWSRFLPTVQQVLKKVNEGIIGEMIKLEATFFINANSSDDDRIFNINLGGGALLDIGIYPLTFAHLFFGNPTKVMSNVEKHHTGVDITETIHYLYDNSEAVLKASFKKDESLDATLYGKHGKIHMPRFWMMEEAFIYDENDELIETIHFPHQVNGFEYQINEVIKRLTNNEIESKIMPHKTTLEILNQMDALRATWKVTYPNEKKD